MQDILAGLTQDSIVTTTETVSTCLRFFLQHCQVKLELFSVVHCFEFSRVHTCWRKSIFQSWVQAYPSTCNFISGKVFLNLSLINDSHLPRPDPKKQVEEDLEKASAILKINDQSEGNSYRLLHVLFTFTLEHHLKLVDFLDTKDDPPSPPPQCGVCGAEASEQENFCSACVTFYQVDLSVLIPTLTLFFVFFLNVGLQLFLFQTSQPNEMEVWECQDQAGYCAIMDSFQYKHNRLCFTSPEGKTLQYVTNRNVLCKLCRF